MNYTQDTKLEVKKDEEDKMTTEKSGHSNSPVPDETQRKDSSKQVSLSQENSDVSRKIFSHHANQRLSPVRIRVAANGSLNQVDNEIYSGNSVCQPSPCTQMETFISSPSTSNISSDMDSTPSLPKTDDHRRQVLKESGIELKEPLSLLANSSIFPPPLPPLQTVTPSSIARFQLDNRVDDRYPSADRMFTNHLESYELDTNTSSKRTNLTFSVENILAPNKFGHNGIKDVCNEDSKEHTDDDDEHGRKTFK